MIAQAFGSRASARAHRAVQRPKPCPHSTTKHVGSAVRRRRFPRSAQCNAFDGERSGLFLPPQGFLFEWIIQAVMGTFLIGFVALGSFLFFGSALFGLLLGTAFFISITGFKLLLLMLVLPAAIVVTFLGTANLIGMAMLMNQSEEDKKKTMDAMGESQDPFSAFASFLNSESEVIDTTIADDGGRSQGKKSRRSKVDEEVFEDLRDFDDRFNDRMRR